MQGLRVTYDFECRALYDLPWRESISTHQVQCNIPTFDALTRKNKYWFLQICRKSKTYGHVGWCSESVCIRPYSLNTTTAFYFVTECSDIAVFFRLRVVTTHSYFTWPCPVQELGSYSAVVL